MFSLRIGVPANWWTLSWIHTPAGCHTPPRAGSWSHPALCCMGDKCLFKIWNMHVCSIIQHETSFITGYTCWGAFGGFHRHTGCWVTKKKQMIRWLLKFPCLGHMQRCPASPNKLKSFLMSFLQGVLSLPSNTWFTLLTTPRSKTVICKVVGGWYLVLGPYMLDL